MFKFIKANVKKSVILGLILVVIIMAIFGGKKTDTGISEYIVDVGEVVDSLSLSGEVKPVEGAEMAFATSGMVDRIYKNPGEKVYTGEKIIELDNATLRADLAYAQATLDLEKAQADISNAENDTAVTNTHNKLLSDNLIAYSIIQDKNATAPIISGTYTGGLAGSYIVEIINSGASASRYAIRYRGLEEGETPVTFYTSVPLGTKGLFMSFVKDQTSISDEWIIKLPNVEGENYTTNLNAYNSALASSQASGPGVVSREIPLARVKQAEANVASIVAKINERILRAPFDGVVSKVDIKKGEIASSGKIITGVISDNAYEVVVEVPEVDIVNLSVGLPVEISLDAYTEAVFSATLSLIDPAETEVSGVSVYRAKVVFNENDPRIRSGMTAKVSILKDKKEDVLRAPARFIQSNEEGNFVVVKTGEESKKVFVTTGLTGSDGLIEITDGLNVGDTLIGDFN